MITILHGDNEVQARKELVVLIEAAHTKGAEVLRIDGKKLEIADLEQALGTDALFASSKLVVIEGVFSVPKSKRKDALLEYIADHAQPEVILIEKKALTATQLKKFPSAKVKLFKYPALLFQWLEGIGVIPAKQSVLLFHQILEHEDAEMCFTMLTRQIRLLVSYKESGVFEGSPFLRAKLASQARYFSLEKLLSLHHELLLLDERQKSSRNLMPLPASLDLILMRM